MFHEQSTTWLVTSLRNRTVFVSRDCSFVFTITWRHQTLKSSSKSSEFLWTKMCMASPAIFCKRRSYSKLNEFSMKKSPNVGNIQRGSEVKLVCWLMVSWSFSLLLLFNNLILFTISCFYGIMRNHYTSLNGAIYFFVSSVETRERQMPMKFMFHWFLRREWETPRCLERRKE